MADIELVIRIPEGLRKDFESEQWTALSCMEMKDALMKGTPLPKGHGRLIDADALEKDDEVTEWLSLNAVRTGKTLKRVSELFIKKIDATPTIIEAESE